MQGAGLSVLLPGPVCLVTDRIGTMAINKGVAPVDLTTQVGLLRSALKDTDYVELAPPEDGFGNYPNFSDLELEGLLARAGGSPLRATGYAYLELAAQAAAEAVDWASDDQRVTLSKRASALTAVAAMWLERADAEDASAGADYFAVEYPFGNPYDVNPFLDLSYERLVNDKW